MKIGIDIRTLMDRQYSGVSGYTFNLVRKILEIDRVHEYRLFYNSGRDMSRHIPEFNHDNAEIIKTRYPNKIFNYLMQKTFSRPKIDRLLGVNNFIAPHINFLSLSDGCKKVITIHDLSFLRYPEFFSARKNIWHRIINVKRLLKRFDVIVAVSENTKRDIIELCDVPEEKIKVIYSGIGRQYRPINRNSDSEKIRFYEVSKKYNLPSDFILYVGTLEPRKNIVGIIAAYNEFREINPGLKNIKLVIAGTRGWKFKEIFRERERSRYRDDIIFLGYVDRGDKVYLYNLARVFVFPSFYEGFGFPPLEAIASGAPVITSAISSLPEVAGGAGLQVDPFNISAISASISMILNDRGLAEILRLNGKKIREKFTWENTAKRYLDLF